GGRDERGRGGRRVELYTMRRRFCVAELATSFHCHADGAAEAVDRIFCSVQWRTRRKAQLPESFAGAAGGAAAHSPGRSPSPTRSGTCVAPRAPGELVGAGDAERTTGLSAAATALGAPWPPSGRRPRPITPHGGALTRARRGAVHDAVGRRTGAQARRGDC